MIVSIFVEEYVDVRDGVTSSILAAAIKLTILLDE